MTAAHTCFSLDREQLARVQKALLCWNRTHASDLPWRRDTRPYAVLVSEFMLQQTQRERVIPKFAAFLEIFPDVETLAAAPASAVIRAWQGLGYNGRALRLHRLARAVVATAERVVPSELELLTALPGIGRYTAGAIACFGFGRQTSFVDTNVRRVLRRVLLGEPVPEPARKLDERLAKDALPPGQAVRWNSALMDLGALVCKAAAPRCLVCPLRADCLARTWFEPDTAAPPDQRGVAEFRRGYLKGRSAGQHRAAPPFVSTDRYLRGRLIDALRCLVSGESIALSALALAATGKALPSGDERAARLVAALEAEGMIESVEVEGEGESRYRLPE
jgi:A/G-specific adenine glycosylase